MALIAADPETMVADPDARARAVIYARVSSSGQLGRDGDEDGYSIPAQVQACEREAAQRGAEVVKVYIERAESARSDNRPVLQQMMREAATLGLRYLIVHKVDRLARNRLDDATLYQKLVGMGIKLVSASENIDETPAGRLMHGMLATFAEYYSNNLATEIKKGLNQKHLSGGTPFKPPVGYLPRRELIGNQDIRSIEVDPERAPLVQLAFDLYASGDWPLGGLAEHLEALGLRSRPTPKRGPSPIRKTSLHKLLRNPYYTGVVVYRGRRVLGRHDALIDRDTFDQVQAVLAAHAIAGDRPSKHEHYLRGSLHCAECGGRLLYTQNRGKGGLYEYFSCINRSSRGIGGRCRTSHYPVPLVERAIVEHYRTVRLTKKVQDAVWGDVRRDTGERAEIVGRDIERQRRAIRTLEDNQLNLVQLSYKRLVSDEVLAREQDRLESEQQQAKALLDKAQLQAEDIDASLEDALAKTSTPYATYKASGPFERRLLNQTFFKRILIGEDSEVLGASLTPVYAALAAWHAPLGQPTGQEKPWKCPTPATQEAESTNPDPISRGRGLHFDQMVELGGLEPPTSWVRSRRSPN
jgi:site-specific DNA recombinase